MLELSIQFGLPVGFRFAGERFLSSFKPFAGDWKDADELTDRDMTKADGSAA
jgi:hypothetical protein